MLDTDHFYMNQALMLARRGELTASPNPMVGCVIVKNGHIIGEGFHHYRGGNHAETMALSTTLESPKDTTVYTTLEPCCHKGVTAPCVNALIKAEESSKSLEPNAEVHFLITTLIHNHDQQMSRRLDRWIRWLRRVENHCEYPKRSPNRTPATEP